MSPYQERELPMALNPADAPLCQLSLQIFQKQFKLNK